MTSPTGIRARTLLPSTLYDNLFRVQVRDGVTYCVMNPHRRGFDPDYWEIVPGLGDDDGDGARQPEG